VGDRKSSSHSTERAQNLIVTRILFMVPDSRERGLSPPGWLDCIPAEPEAGLAADVHPFTERKPR
jgi:hypothetical protein